MRQWKLGTDRLIVVLKMSGRCTVRSIVEVLEYGLGISVSVGYVQNIITQAGENAEGKFQKLLLRFASPWGTNDTFIWRNLH